MAIITVTTEPVQDPQAPTPTHYQTVSGALIAALDSFSSIIPRADEAEVSDAKQVRRNLNVPDAFCFAAISAAEQLPELDTAKQMYAERGRIRLQYLEAIRPLYDKLLAVTVTVGHDLRANKSAVARDSLEIYRLVTAQKKSSRNPALLAAAGTLKNSLGRKGLTKAERDERKKLKLAKAIEQAVQQRLHEAVEQRLQQVLAAREKEVRKAA